MSVIVEGWERGECPIVDGIYFPNDNYFPLELFVAVDHLSVVSSTTGKGKLIVEPPLAEDTRFQVYGGETSWEGCGYLALVSKPDQTLVWLINSSTSEPFREAQIESDKVVAISREYPFSYKWHVPIATPCKLAVQKVE